MVGRWLQLLLEGAGLDPKGCEQNGVKVMGVLPELSEEAPVCLEHADGITLIFRLRRDTPAWAVPIGDLRLTWRRKECVPPVPMIP